MIQRSSLPTVVVEGKDDVTIYRWMEAFLKDANLDFLPCNTRSVLLSLFDRRQEFVTKPVAFVADQDMWVLTAPPGQYADVIFTAGYSIENDVLSCRAADRLFDSGESAAFAAIMLALEEWFAFEASQYIAGQHFVIDVPLRKVVDIPSYSLNASLGAERGFVPASGPIREKIRSNPFLHIRGKNLLDAYTHLLNGETRSSRYSRKAILELCVKLPDNHYNCVRLIESIRGRFSGQ
jgi:hypothetical protein